MPDRANALVPELLHRPLEQLGVAAADFAEHDLPLEPDPRTHFIQELLRDAHRLTGYSLGTDLLVPAVIQPLPLLSVRHPQYPYSGGTAWSDPPAEEQVRLLYQYRFVLVHLSLPLEHSFIPIAKHRPTSRENEQG